MISGNIHLPFFFSASYHMTSSHLRQSSHTAMRRSRIFREMESNRKGVLLPDHRFICFESVCGRLGITCARCVRCTFDFTFSPCMDLSRQAPLEAEQLYFIVSLLLLSWLANSNKNFIQSELWLSSTCKYISTSSINKSTEPLGTA